MGSGGLLCSWVVVLCSAVPVLLTFTAFSLYPPRSHISTNAHLLSRPAAPDFTHGVGDDVVRP